MCGLRRSWMDGTWRRKVRGERAGEGAITEKQKNGEAEKEMGNAKMKK